MVTAKGNGYLLDDDGAYHVITTAADDDTTALSVERPRVVVKGTGINHIFTTPSAAALTRAHFVISNWSSEFVGVMNSDSTLWLRVAPAQTATVYLVTGGTAAGVWGAELSTINRDYGFHLTEDFITGATTVTGQTQNGLFMSASGTGASSRSIGIAATHGANVIGIGELYSGTDTASTAYFVFYNSAMSSAFGLALGCYAERVRLNVASDGTNTYVARFGFGDSITSTSHNDGAWLEYDSTASAKWLMCAASRGTATKTATSIADIEFNTTKYDLAIEIASDASRADFWVNRVHVGTISDANVPQASETFGMVHILANVAGTANNRRCTMDRTAIMGAMPTRRA